MNTYSNQQDAAELQAKKAQEEEGASGIPPGDLEVGRRYRVSWHALPPGAGVTQREPWSEEDRAVLAGMGAKMEKANESLRNQKPVTHEEALAQAIRFKGGSLRVQQRRLREALEAYRKPTHIPP